MSALVTSRPAAVSELGAHEESHDAHSDEIGSPGVARHRNVREHGLPCEPEQWVILCVSPLARHRGRDLTIAIRRDSDQRRQQWVSLE